MPDPTLARSGTVSVVLRDQAALLAASPAPTCEIALTTVSWTYAGTGGESAVTGLTIHGVAWGTTKVDVTVDLPGVATLALPKANVASNKWTATVAVAPFVPVGASVRVGMSAAGGGNCQAAASEWIALGLEERLVPDAGSCEAGFESGRNHFVAGHFDRLVRTRYFVPLLCSNFEMGTTSKTHLARALSKVGISRKEAYARANEFAESLRSAGRDTMQALSERNAGERVAAAIRKAVGDVAKTLVVKGEPAAQRKRAAGRADVETILSKAAMSGGLALGVRGPRRTGEPRASDPEVFGGYQGVLRTVGGSTIGVQAGLEQYALGGWVGVLFYDRLRFRPSGLVAGEQVYSLALAPGEEVTLTQRSETKRSRSFEDVLDRTAEAELEFSSTWSTDVSQQNTDSETTSVGGNLGVSVGIPIEVVEVGINGGVNASQSNTISATRQRSRSTQVTSRFAAKTREQHKTTFKVSTDLTEEFGSKRLLRNPNPSRALTLNFYKLYSKQRILLERYDAKLSISLCLPDPGATLRAELESEFAKLDGKVPPGVCPEIPKGASTSSTKNIMNLGADAWGTDEYGVEQFSTVLPANTVLSDWFFEITEWMVDDGTGNVYSADVTEFEAKGGFWNFTGGTEPQIGTAGSIQSIIYVLMPEAWGPGWWTVSVKGKMSWSWVASDQITQQVQTCLAEESKKIRDSFSAERVMQILEEVKAGERELVFQRVFESVLFRDYFQLGTNPPCALVERVRNLFDWNEAAVEYLPWWMTPGGRDEREKLRTRLLKLPGDTRSDLIIDDKLVASAARVHLPIRPGLEGEALAFMLGVSSIAGSALEGCVEDFVKWRDANLGEIAFTMPTYDTVLSVDTPRATRAGAADWDEDWERARRRFLVLDEWSETLPTDGVHVEPGLSACGSVDEFRSSALRADLESMEARREVDVARARLETALAAKPSPATTVVIGDPGARLP